MIHEFKDIERKLSEKTFRDKNTDRNSFTIPVKDENQVKQKPKVPHMLTTYSCSFTEKLVKISIELPVEIVESSIEHDVTARSLSITMDGVNKLHYKFSVKELSDKILPEEFTFKVVLKFLLLDSKVFYHQNLNFLQT